MKTFKYVFLCLGLAMSWVWFQGMASAPKLPETLSVCYNQVRTSYVNNIIQNCVSDVLFGNEVTNNISCTHWVLFFTNEYHDQIINRYGNVL